MFENIDEDVLILIKVRIKDVILESVSYSRFINSSNNCVSQKIT